MEKFNLMSILLLEVRTDLICTGDLTDSLLEPVGGGAHLSSLSMMVGFF